MTETDRFSRILIPAADGSPLCTDILLPDNGVATHPVMAIRSPYQPCTVRPAPFLKYAEYGFALVMQDCRGTGKSGGDADFWAQEKEDGEAFLAWLRKQSWFNGSLFLYGESYAGYTQWAIANSKPGELAGFAPHNAPVSPDHDLYRPGSSFSLALLAQWAFLLRELHGEKGHFSRGDLTKRPLRELDSLCGFLPWRQWRSWLDLPDSGLSGAECNPEDTPAPVFLSGGWFDLFVDRTLRTFHEIRQHGKTNAIRSFTRCIIEPVDHAGQQGEWKRGPEALAGLEQLRSRFFCNLAENPYRDPMPDLPPLRMYVMGAERWMDADDFPPPGSVIRPLYLCGDQSLSFSPDSCGPESRTFRSDPDDPVPTCGGNVYGLPSGQRRQNETDLRPDVLLYESPLLTKPLTVIGFVEAVLTCSADSPSADYAVTLCDVFPDGTSRNVCSGLTRAGFSSTGEIKPIRVSCQATAYHFPAGHRIRVRIAGSDFPAKAVNCHTGLPLGAECKGVLSRQTIWHSNDKTSCLLLPVFSGSLPE